MFWGCQSAHRSGSTLCFKKNATLLLLRQLRQMLPDLAAFGRDYRSVNLQHPSAYLLEMEIFSVVEYQLKCCSVANDAAPDCHMVRSGAACYGQGHQQVAWTAAHLCES